LLSKRGGGTFICKDLVEIKVTEGSITCKGLAKQKGRWRFYLQSNSLE